MKIHKKEAKGRKYVPIGIKVKSAILFSMFLTILSRPLARNVPELVLTLNVKGISYDKVWHQQNGINNLNNAKDIYFQY